MITLYCISHVAFLDVNARLFPFRRTIEEEEDAMLVFMSR